MQNATREQVRDERGPPSAYVVEDDPWTLRLLTDLVESAGLKPTAFSRLSTARKALRERVPALLLVDDELPDGQGAELVREIRSTPHMRHLRVIFCTAADKARRREIEALAPVIAKPFRLTEMEHVLSEAARSQ